MSEIQRLSAVGVRVTDTPSSIELLEQGRLELAGRLMHASNGTFYCDLTLDGTEAAAVYKPIRGERPLWDFPHGTLAGRELATYLVSEALGWSVVPPTVLREGPLGPGMVQLWISEVEGATIDLVPLGQVPAGWHRVLDAYDQEANEISLVHADTPQLRRVALLDVIANNADRKGGHLLPAPDGHVHGVDHGLCFHVDDKLRTVLWGWAGDPLTESELAELSELERALSGELGVRLGELLTPEEIGAAETRIGKVRSAGVFPVPSEDWPSIPWPVF